MPALVNLKLLSHPLNWVFVWIVLALASMAYLQFHNAIVAGSADGSISPD